MPDLGCWRPRPCRSRTPTRTTLRESIWARSRRRLKSWSPCPAGGPAACHCPNPGRRRIDVGMGVHPYEPQLAALLAQCARDPGDRAHRQAMVAAQADRHAARGGRAVCLLLELAADLEDGRPMLELGAALGLGSGDLDVAGFDDVKAEVPQRGQDVGPVDGRRAARSAPLARAPIQRDADQGSLALHEEWLKPRRRLSWR